MSAYDNWKLMNEEDEMNERDEREWRKEARLQQIISQLEDGDRDDDCDDRRW